MTTETRARFELTPVFWIAGLVLLCMIGLLIMDWPNLSDQVDDILKGLKFTLVGIFLPLLWINGRKARRYEKVLMVFALSIPIAALLYWFHFRVVTIRVVGNSYGSLEAELNEFNNSHSRIRAELVYDWGQLDTNERFGKFWKYLKGKDGIDLIEIDDIWMNSAIDIPEDLLLPLDSFPVSREWEVIKFLTRSSTMYSRATHPDLSRRRLPPDMNLFSKLAMQYDFLPYVEKALSVAKPRPRIKNYQTLSGLLSKAIYSILSDERMTDKAVDDALDGVQKELDR